MTLRRWSVAVAALLAGCGAATEEARGPIARRPTRSAAVGGVPSEAMAMRSHAAGVVTIGRPVAPRPVRDTPGGPGTEELRARAPGGGPEWLAGVVTPPRG